ncbi:uncharacterized protein LAJ45_11139 [Morchella importuna]|uniref:uncharacterized protein n=1 Tax=Morchella importuna TaxID=1174673 RepID=UPI001E8E5242|nr:uncharacterized protein LAJ45_11139 [Morchella importuna]KAH8144869.1 hypothetical protein LAJ45_11139 [Morchella importuna]
MSHSKSPISLNIIIVGAGLGGLSAAITLCLAGHHVTVLERATTIGEIGAGIQILPNASRLLISWGLAPSLMQHATLPKQVNMISWKGEHIASMDFHEAAKRYGSPFWDFHRAGLHKCLLERAVELGARVVCQARVMDVEIGGDKSTVVLEDGSKIYADLVVGADGVASRMREVLMGGVDPPMRTGDLAYRVLLSTEEMKKDPELKGFVEDPQVNYWLGPDCHAVNYVLKGGKQFNMVLLVPDDIPDGGATTVEGNVEEMRALYKDWDPRIPKLLSLCTQVHKWKLLIRHPPEHWYHPSGTFVLLGDSAHATLPYLASGAGMALEDAAVLGECLGRIRSREDVLTALAVYEVCRKERTARVVERGNVQQELYHLHDGEEQRERDRKMRMFPTEAGEALAWRDPEMGPWLLGWQCEREVDRCWPKAEMPHESAAVS